MTALDERKRQTISRNFSLVVDFLDRKFRKTPIHLQETPCYFYKGNKSKLEITVLPDPRIAKVNVRIIGFKSFDREPYYQCSYDLDRLSIAVFQRDIDDLIFRMD
jgi:hypothetical protein